MTLSNRLLLLVALALLPPLAIQTWSGLEQGREREAALRMQALAQSRAAEADVAREVEGVRQLLVALSELPAIRAGDAAGCTAVLRAVAGQLRDYALLAAERPDGGELCSSLDAPTTGRDDAGHPVLAPRMSTSGTSAPGTGVAAAGDLEAAELAIGEPVAAVGTGQPALPFSLPLRGGSPGGRVAATLRLAHLSHQLVQGALPPGSVALVLSPNGIVAAATQDGRVADGDWIGRPVPAPLLQALHGPAGAMVATGPDGKPRLFGITAADTRMAGLRVTVGLDEGRALRELDRATAWALGALALGVALAMVLAGLGARRFVLRPLARLAEAADRVGRGELGARADLGRRAHEVREVGAAFDRMSAALAQREAERDRAEARWRAGEARLARLLATVPAGVLEFDADGRFTFANDAALRMLGTSAADLVGRRYDDPGWSVTTPEGRELSRARLPTGRALAGEAAVNQELALTLPDGRTMVLLADAVPVRGPDGAILGAVAAFQDIGERHRQAAALRDSEARFRSFADNATDVLWIIDVASRRLEYVSPSLEAIWGETRETLLADRAGWMATLHPAERAVALELMPRAAAGEVCRVEYRIVRRDGTERWLRDTAFPIRDEDGRVARVGGIARDVTEDKAAEARQAALAAELAAERGRMVRLNDTLEREVAERTAELMAAEESLHQSQKMEAVGQLTGGIAHDFNNMLQAISGALEMMRRRVERGRAEETLPFLDSARATVERAAALTHRLLAFARRQTLQPRPVEPDRLVMGMAELIRRTVGPSVALELRCAAPGWTVLCDPSQLENALLNLAINARDAMPGGGRLAIATAGVAPAARDLAGWEAGRDGTRPAAAGAGAFLEIVVSDTGTGMDEATRARAFEPFFTTKPAGQGTGLGLSQLYGFVRQSGGLVRLEGGRDGGTAARILLPWHSSAAASLEPAAASPRASEEPRTGQGRCVLLVEDEAEVRALIGGQLRECGYEVLEAVDGPAALALAPARAVHLLVTDVGLPGGLTGREVARALRRRWPGLPVLFVTGYAGHALDEALEPGMAVIGKPFALEALAATVRGMLEPTG